MIIGGMIVKLAAAAIMPRLELIPCVSAANTAV